MAINIRQYFFDPLNPDRFKDFDIPTEAIFRDLTDSISFFKHVSDRAQRTKAGLAKTVSDGSVNARNGADAMGVSPIGFTTFVQPQQVPIVRSGINITVVPTIRIGGSDPNAETGNAIMDYVVNFSGAIPTDTDDIVLASTLNWITLGNPYPYTLSSTTVLAGVTTTVTLQDMVASLGVLATQVNVIADKLALAEAVLQNSIVEVGDCLLSMTDPTGWDTNYFLEPRGQLLLVASYTTLYAKIGVSFGGIAGLNFNLPNLSEDTAYIGLLRAGTAGVGTLTGIANYSLSVANIPQHTHNFSGNTSIDGAHTHDITVRDALIGFTRVDGNGGGASTNIDTVSILAPGSEHSHSIPIQPTTAYGTLVPTPIPMTPRRMNTYLKMRVK